MLFLRWLVALGLFLASISAMSLAGPLKRIRVSDDGSHFVCGNEGERFVVWGVNYDHNAGGALLEDYWHDDWASVEGDFLELKELGAKVIRIHLQVGRLMKDAGKARPKEVARLRKLVQLAEATGLYLDLTGLGCYHKEEVPEWYDALDEAERWEVQARFWEAVAQVGSGSKAVFCYDLMNEPILPGRNKVEQDWLVGDFGGKHFVQRIALDLAGRSREEVARSWVKKMSAAIRKHDGGGLITVGVIPWALTFPKAKPVFYSEKVRENLDFVSVHFYPEAGRIDQALEALSVYELGLPLVIEEMFPLKCGIGEMETFVKRSAEFADGWLSFYWGRRIDEYPETGGSLAESNTRTWLGRFRELGVEMREGPPKETPKSK